MEVDSMFHVYENESLNEKLEVRGIPFSVKRENGVVAKLPSSIGFDARCEMLFFLGMSTDSWQCSEWWGQQEVYYDYSTRLFFGDRVGRIRVLYDDRTEELISVIFGVNCWNYNLFFKPKPHENIMHFSAPYDEPFRSDPEARKILEESLRLMENTDEACEKATKWVFAYKVRPEKRIIKIDFGKEEAKRSDFVVSGVTALLAGGEISSDWDYVTQEFFLRKDYYKPVDRLRRRIYQFRDELPERDEIVNVENFDAPDIVFKGNGLADIYTNVYRKNIMDMAYNKVTDDGMPHTSSRNTANYGCYIGFGTYTIENSYFDHVWTRDIGRTLIEITNLGYFDRARRAADRLHELLYYPSIRFKIPHWKRIANLVAKDENDLHNEGKENDGHASIMLFIYNLYNKGAVDRKWLVEHKKELKDAADYYIWQYENPEQSNFNGILYSESEASTQIYGGYDLFSNIISILAIEGYARLFDEIEDFEYAKRLRKLAKILKEGARKYFLMEHPRYGKVYTDTTDDCWTYEYKRLGELFLQSDLNGYDVFNDDSELFDIMTRTFMAQKEVFYAPESGRQMGYGQGYLTLSTLALDLFDELTECMEAATMMCYHHTDNKYIVPEGVIMHGSKQFWFRNCDLGNAVQQAEIVKCARLVVGIDDIDKNKGIRLVPRLPDTWDGFEAKDFPVTLKDGTVKKFSFAYGRNIHSDDESKIIIKGTDGTKNYTAVFDKDIPVEYLRMGPFDYRNINISGKEYEVKKIHDRFFAYVKI
jgi:hypothetical protein